MYGFNECALVGDLVLSDDLIPHDILRDQHHEINDRCHIQAYPIRSTWMRYIDEMYGRDTLLAINYPTTPPDNDFFVQTLGVSLSTVDSSWQTWILQKHEAIPGAAQVTDAYRQKTSWYQYCQY